MPMTDETNNKKTTEAKKTRSHNCTHSGNQFKIHKLTRLQCEHPKWTDEKLESGDACAWDTLQVFNANCSDHEFKPVT